LSILMDSKARPKAQMTITTTEPSADSFLMSMDDAEAAQFKAKYPDLPIYNERAVKATPEYQDWESYNPPKMSITEIKGVHDKTNLINEPYLKQIQDEIQSMELDDVENLDGIGMKRLPENPMQLLDLFDGFRARAPLAQAFGTEQAGFKAVRDEVLRLNKGSQFTIGNEDDVSNLLHQAVRNVLPQQKAHGGMIERQPTDNRRYL